MLVSIAAISASISARPSVRGSGRGCGRSFSACAGSRSIIFSSSSSRINPLTAARRRRWLDTRKPRANCVRARARLSDDRENAGYIRPTPPRAALPARRRILFETLDQCRAQRAHPLQVSDFSTVAVTHVKDIERLVGVGRNPRKVNHQSKLEKRMRNREQQPDAILGKDVDDRELLGGAIVDGDLARNPAHELARAETRTVRVGDELFDVLLAVQHPLEVVLDPQPALLLHRKAARAREVRDAKDIERNLVR